MSTDISALANRPVIIGGGAAGLMTALHLAPEPVVLLSKAPLGAEASSLWAQGGLAAAMGDGRRPCPASGRHHRRRRRSLRRGRRAAGSSTRRRLRSNISRGSASRFDRRPDGGWRLGLEAAHSRNRIVHATGDGTGREIMRALIAAVRRMSVDHAAGRRRGAQADRRGQRDQGRARRERARPAGDRHRPRRASRPAASAGCFSTAPIRPAASVRASRWRRARARSFPISNSSSFIRPRSTGRRARCRCSPRPFAATAQS